ncbi:hypothetical protein J2Z21_006879 [Streptomyces griseochromogenes]|uniref:Uncharacterized protein n=1 Tax=Streptomyces griseochromogenes TaxID=68214 RepID=A0A1B1B360_9ACTN|nr:hypothetical protein [Streptomyces griseochromogenes]ANP53182.1 hypothetical protein AVL59_29865 [Streptomyces griseochromogenes]MBP2053877.1 hypothetical protein [Streptomyces griseochromogenes]
MDDHGVVRELVEKGVDDGVPVDRLLGPAGLVARNGAEDFREVVIELPRRLTTDGLIAVGGPGENGFEAWPETCDELPARAVGVLDGVGRNPRLGAYRPADTPKGDAAASGGSKARA